jgi:short-subunit dehydrogenase
VPGVLGQTADETVSVNQSDGEALQSLARRLSEISDLDLLVNNAGFSTMGILWRLMRMCSWT